MEVKCHASISVYIKRKVYDALQQFIMIFLQTAVPSPSSQSPS